MPFAAVITWDRAMFLSPLSRFSARKGISGSGLCPLTMLRHLANLQAPGAVRQGIPPFLERTLRGLERLCIVLGLCHVGPLLGQDNACALPGHLLTVEMLPSPARDGPFP